MDDESTELALGRGDRWWESAIGVTRASLKTTGRTLRDLISDLDRIADLGLDVIELFAPCHGGTTYEGLDVIDFYAVDPALGTRADFEALVRECHRRGIALVAFLNLGYVNEQYPGFVRACDDKAQGITSADTRMFLWADAPDEELPFPADAHFLQGSAGRWQWSERAQSHYWVKWEGESGGHPLPQLNWSDPAWRLEAHRIIDFWREAGADGVVLDAVNWYVGCDWPAVREIALESGHPTYSHPEGAGGFGDDPVPWITNGGFTVLMDYSLKVWWDDVDLIRDAVVSGDHSVLESALQRYRDEVDAAGGICYINPPRPRELGVRARLAAAVVATVGQLYFEPYGLERMSGEEVAIAREMLALRRAFPSLTACGPRAQVHCSDPSAYAFLRGAGRDRVLVVLNFADSRTSAVCDIPTELQGGVVTHTAVPVTLGPLDFTVIPIAGGQGSSISPPRHSQRNP